MPKSKVLFYSFIGLFFASLVNAATIYGTVYDLSLKKLDNAIVEINTVPKQFIVAQNGSYAFNVPNGGYTIKARLMQKNALLASVQENITIKQDGAYVIDLILFPNVEEGLEDIDIDVNGNIVEANRNWNYVLAGLAILLIFIVVVGVHYFNKNKIKKADLEEGKKTKSIKIEEGETKEKNDSYDLEQIIAIIKKEGGRTTQKDIRKQIPLSEAKISLMIAELEHKGLIEKIKKGRGNIIILKK